MAGAVLGPACWMPAAVEQASRGSDMPLPACRWLGIGLVFTSGGRACSGGRGQLLVGWGGPWHVAGEKFSQVARVCDACSHVVRMAGFEPGGQALPATWVGKVCGAEAQQDRLDD